MKKSELKKQVAAAIQACLEKKAEELSILEMEKGSGAFTDYFVLCSGTNPRQVQAIADEVELRLKSCETCVRARRGLQAGRVGAARLRGFRGARILGKGAQVLRSGAAVEDGQAAGSLRSEDSREATARRRSGVEQSVNEPGRGEKEEESESLAVFLRDFWNPP